jgi:hypothetical protein
VPMRPKATVSANKTVLFSLSDRRSTLPRVAQIAGSRTFSIGDRSGGTTGCRRHCGAQTMQSAVWNQRPTATGSMAPSGSNDQLPRSRWRRDPRTSRMAKSGKVSSEFPPRATNSVGDRTWRWPHPTSAVVRRVRTTGSTATTEAARRTHTPTSSQASRLRSMPSSSADAKLATRVVRPRCGGRSGASSGGRRHRSPGGCDARRRQSSEATTRASSLRMPSTATHSWNGPRTQPQSCSARGRRSLRRHTVAACANQARKPPGGILSSRCLGARRRLIVGSTGLSENEDFFRLGEGEPSARCGAGHTVQKQPRVVRDVEALTKLTLFAVLEVVLVDHF